jgi:DNA topoisomerase IB
MRLRRSRLDAPGIRRVRCRRGFRYVAPAGGPVDAATEERIRSLAIPPAWEDVWISPFPNGHIQAIGVDAAGRRQYRYHDAWRARRDAEKFVRILDFARRLPQVRAAVTADLCLSGLPRDRVLALGVRLLDVGMFRIGGEEYAEQHETFGLATIERRHVGIRDGVACFDYPAKGGIRRQIEVSDPVVVELLTALKRRRGGGSGLLAWREEGQWVDVGSHDLNSYLKAHMGEEFSAKDFRTWEATLLAAVLCAGSAGPGSSASARRRNVAGVLREVAASLGNTPAVCRKSYIDPRVFERFECGETIVSALEHLKAPVELSDLKVLQSVETALIAMLDDAASLAA